MMHGERLVTPGDFLGMPVAAFGPVAFHIFDTNARSFVKQGTIDPDTFPGTAELIPAKGVDSHVATTALYMWFTAIARRQVVFTQTRGNPLFESYDGEVIATHGNSRHIKNLASCDETSVVALRLFGTSQVRHTPAEALAGQQYSVNIESSASEVPLDHEALCWAVAGATALVNEVLHGVQPDQPWTPSWDPGHYPVDWTDYTDLNSGCS